MLKKKANKKAVSLYKIKRIKVPVDLYYNKKSGKYDGYGIDIEHIKASKIDKKRIVKAMGL